MIELITGVPGSGKTSYAIVRLAKTFSKDEELKKSIPNQFKIPDVDKAFTNINEIKTDKFNNVGSLHFDDMLENLTILEEHYKKDKYTDKELKTVAKEMGIFNAMYIIDECHNQFDTQNKVLVWWLSYHRHLNQHIILLTQNLSLVHTKYKAFPEIYLKAIPATLKILDTSIVLKKYTNSRLAKNSQAGQIKIKKNPKIFELYGSGANHKSKSVILPYIIFSLVLILLIYLYFTYSNSTKEAPAKNKPVSNQKIIPVISQSFPTVKKINLNNKKMINLYCNRSECFYKDFILPYSIISKLEKLNSTLLFKRKINFKQIKYTILLSQEFYNLLDIQKKDFILGVNVDEKSSANYYNISK